MVHRSDSELNLDFIVFEGRNHAYGAFDNRLRYNTRLRQSLIIVFFFCSAVVATQIIFNHFFTAHFINSTPPPDIIHVIDTDIPLIEKPLEKRQETKAEVVENKSSSGIPVITDKPIEANKNPDQNPDEGPTVSTIGNAGGSTLANLDSTSTSLNGTNDTSLIPEEILGYADEMPEFPGGNEGLNKYITRNIVFPEDAVRDGVAGKVYVSFIIGKDGEIRDVKLERGIDKRCDLEAIRVVSIMPKWKAGKAKGKLVSVKKIVPIIFKNEER